MQKAPVEVVRVEVSEGKAEVPEHNLVHPRKANLRFRSEFFNVFNHPDFGAPNNNLTSPLFGQSTQILASSLVLGGASGGGFSLLY